MRDEPEGSGFIPHPSSFILSKTVISLARRSPGGSSSLPGSRSGPDQPCSLIWPCSRWGLPSQPVTRLLVGSYIKELTPPHLFTLTPTHHAVAVCFLLHF